MASTDMQANEEHGSAKADPTDFVLSPKLSFPEKLMMILEKDLAPTAIWFLPGDRTFAIHSKNFSSEVLDKYFQRTKFMSFVRKLNQWGFRRIPGHTVPKGAVAYVHSLFRKGCPELLKDICDRKKTRSKAKAQAKDSPKPAAAMEIQQASSPVAAARSSPPLVESRAAQPSAMVMPPAAAALPPRASPPQNVQTISGALSEQLQQLIAASSRNSSAAAASSLHAPLLGNLQDHLRAKPTPAPAPSSSLDLSSILQRELASQLLAQSTSSMYSFGSTMRPRPTYPSSTAASLRNLSSQSYLGGGLQLQDTNNATALQLLQLLSRK